MTPRLVTFDAAETLIKVRWQPGPFAVSCARLAGLQLDEQPAQESYERLLRSRWRDYCALNQTRDNGVCDAFWRELTDDWLKGQNQAARATDQVVAKAAENLFACFELYDDVLPALDHLRSRGVSTAVVSNWDYSLHRILRHLGIYDRFDAIFASLEEGPEKPDPRLFEIVLARFELEAKDAVHVGDNPLDDLQGARNAGMAGLLLDRARQDYSPPTIPNLSYLEVALQWLG